MNKPSGKFRDTYFITGLWMTACSAILFFLPLIIVFSEDQFFLMFIGNYGLTVAYLLALVFSGRLKAGRDGQYCYSLFLVLSLISAYALNRCLPVFEVSAGWLTAMLIIVCIAYMLHAFMDALPAIVQHAIMFITGAGFVLFIYLSIYLFPLYPACAIGSIFLGFSLHAFVPLLFVVFTCRQVIRLRRENRAYLWSISGGIAFPVIAAILFTWNWSRLNSIVNRQYQHTLIAENNDLPSWIKVAQQLPDNPATEKFLKSSLVYSVPSGGNDFFGWRMPSRNFDEVRRHDPLVMIAALLNPSRSISQDERIKMLESGYNARHKTQNRLWNGDHLSTTNIITNLRIWPQFRIAYTEKTITVASSEPAQNWRRNDEEAIYTFHLPEGGVITSLSLWIDGKEAKGILTTKGKADTAYRQIVGVERHDPSVVHWQEGNTVSVRVFPVPANGSRIFRIGITAPLTLTGKELRYDNIYFDGPDASVAKEIVRVAWDKQSDKSPMQGFESEGAGRYIREGSYRQDWRLQFADPGLSDAAFSFNGAAYSIHAYHPRSTPANMRQVYLDINEAWSMEDFEAVYSSRQGREAFAWDDGLIRLDDANRHGIFKRLSSNHFSLFPLHEITDPETSLLVTKCSLTSPDISDLKETAFARRLEPWLQQHSRLRLFNLGDGLSPYLKTLKEHRTFLYTAGDAAGLKNLLARNSFVSSIEDSGRVVIDNAQIVLSKTAGNAASTAPDHLMRLFAYNHLMQQLHRGIFTNLEADSALVQEAQQAYVVTPLSSLIVLETAADYERFNIKDSGNSLKNASLKSTGAVPEPHEWALIILALLMMAWLRFKNNLRLSGQGA